MKTRNSLAVRGGGVLVVCLAAMGCAASAAQPWGTDSRPNGWNARADQATRDGFGRVSYPQFPAASPDGRWITFAWAGDLWVSPIQGGKCIRLTSHPAEERRSVWSPDGKRLAFESTRDGARNLYVMELDAAGDRVMAGNPVRVTVSDATQGLGTFTADGKGLLFATGRDPTMYRGLRMFRVELRTDSTGMVVGGGPVSRLSDVFGQMPRASADGKTVVFFRNNAGLERPKYRGSGNTDVWSHDTSAGAFVRLTDDPANDTDPWIRPDGSVVFISSRDGQNNLWRIDGVGGEGAGRAAQQLTMFAPTAEQVTIGHGVRDLSVSGDGRIAVFAVWDTLYRLDLTARGAKPEAIEVRAAGDSIVPDVQRMNLDREITEHALSPDGKTLAVVARGEVFVRSMQEGHPTRRVTDTPGRERDLAWSPDGRVLYFVSDDAGPSRPEGVADGAYGLYAATVELSREDLTPQKSAAGTKPAEDPKDEPVKPDAAGEPEPPAEPGADEPAAADAKEKPKGAAKKDAKPDHGKRWAESLRYKVELLIPPNDRSGREDLRAPVPSPDGKKLLFTRGRGELVLLDLATKAERVIVDTYAEADAQWAADSRHIIYAIPDLDYNSDIWLMDTQSEPDTGPGERGWTNPVNLTRHPDIDSSARLSADGKVLTFLSDRGGANGDYDVYQIYLDRSLETMTAYERDEYFKKAGEAASKRKPLGAGADKDAKPGDKKAGEDKDKAEKAPEPMKFDAADAYLRVRQLVSLPGAESGLAITPGADRVIFNGSVDTDRALLSVDHKGGDRKTLQAGGVTRVDVSLTGDKVLFVRDGRVSSTNPKSGGKVDALPIDAPVVIDIAKQQRQKFLEAARTFGAIFYHPTMKGLDWSAVTARYLSLAAGTRTNEEFNRVGQSLFGEVDASHTGVSGGAAFVPSAPSPSIGYLGAFTEPAAGGFRITQIHKGTPADGGPEGLAVGDVIVAVDGARLAVGEGDPPTMDIDAALAGKSGKETLVEVRRAAGGTRLFLVTPISMGAWDQAQYWDGVARRQEEVDRLSGGRLGYLHIRAMGEASVRDFERDLYAAGYGKEGLIIDVRDNGGGSTADILLSALTAPRHAWTAPRLADPTTVPQDSYPRDRRLIYAWTRPINVLINQNSFSNAEIFAHAIKTIGRGKLVGTATFGGVISTGGTTLIDGTSVRLPLRGWYLPDGTDMENNGAKPDIEVTQTPDDEVAGRDRQLEAAVEELLGRVGTGAAAK